MDRHVRGCVSVLLLCGRLSSCCELPWGVQLSPPEQCPSCLLSRHSFFPVGVCPPLPPPPGGAVAGSSYDFMASWCRPFTPPRRSFSSLWSTFPLLPYQETVPPSSTYLATLRLSPSVPSLLFVICLFPCNLSCFFPSPTVSALHSPPTPPFLLQTLHCACHQASETLGP